MRSVAAAFLLISLLFSCNKKEEFPRNIHLSGTITDAATGAPLSRAGIWVRKTQNNVNYDEVKVLTAAGGDFEINFQPYQTFTYSVLISKDGYNEIVVELFPITDDYELNKQLTRK